MARAEKPTIAELARRSECPNCGGKVERKSARGPMPTFCSKACKVDHQNRHIAEGRVVIALLKAWRIDRGTGETAQGAFAQAISALDHFNAEDRKAGRPRPDLYASKILITGTMPFDRMAG